MLSLVRRASNALRREGFREFAKRALVWFDLRTGLVSFLLLPYIKFVLGRVKDADSLVGSCLAIHS